MICFRTGTTLRVFPIRTSYTQTGAGPHRTVQEIVSLLDSQRNFRNSWTRARSLSIRNLLNEIPSEFLAVLNLLDRRGFRMAFDSWHCFHLQVSLSHQLERLYLPRQSLTAIPVKLFFYWKHRVFCSWYLQFVVVPALPSVGPEPRKIGILGNYFIFTF